MNYRDSIIGLVSVAVLMSACTSIKGSPGYRSNIKNKGFQRSDAIRELEPAAVGLSRPVLHPTDDGGIQAVGYREETPPATPAWDSMPSGSVTTPQDDKDVELILGSQQYYRSDIAAPSTRSGKSSGEAGVALNFERASIREVVKVVLGDILKETYTVEPGVEGEVTINSTDPIPRESLIPTLESLLQSQGAVLYRDDTGNYRVAARANLKGRGMMPSTGGKIKPGYSMQVVTLRYIPVTEMQKILEPIASPDAFVRVDPNRNMMVLAGTSSELANLMATINTFDVNVLKGMSVGIYRLKNVEVSVVAKNLDALFGESGNSPMAGMIKIMPIEHMNSIMIISANPDYLRDMKDWVDRFDQVSQTAGQQLFVYQVQNGDAEHLADMLNQIFGGKKSSSSNGALPGSNTSSLAPGLDAATVGADGKPVADPVKTMLGGSDGGVTINPDAEVRIVADKINNSLMIMSNEDAYRQILESLKRIDVMPMQVQVEASIMEVTLTDGLEYGLQWYFKNNGNAFGANGLGGLSSGSNGYTTPGGFSFSATLGADRVMGALNALARQSKVRVLSSPSILVLDNQTASIKVGDQQPVFTGSLSTPNGNGTSLTTATTVQYKDTGVSLQVTPHVNTNGLVKMDIQQDITDVGEVDSATGNRSFLQRNIKSNVAVKSGETIVLGGLIRDNNTEGRNGVPGLSNVPVVGSLFSGNSKGGKRTELLVLITPTAIKDQRDLVKTGEEMRDRMRRLMDGDKFFPQLRGQYVE